MEQYLQLGTQVNGLQAATVNTGGTFQGFSGIDYDNCGRIYIGLDGVVKRYSASLVFDVSFPTSGAVYDLQLDPLDDKKLFVTGNGFVQLINIGCPTCITETHTNASGCTLGTATATVNDPAATAPLTYSWNTVPIQTTQTATGLVAGNYIVVVTDAAAPCALTWTIQVTITGSATVNAATISYTSPVCNTSAVAQNPTFTGTTGGTYSSTAGLTINAATGVITPNTSTAGTYTVTYTIAAAGGCPAFTTTATIVIGAGPTATISYTSPFCSTNATVQNPTITGNTTGTFSSTAGLTINPTTGGITPNTSTVGTYTVTYTIAAAGGCAAVTSTASVTISAGPTATISYASPFCSTNTTDQNPTITGNTTGTFASTAGLTINTTTGAITPNTSTIGTYTVTYTIAASGGCAAVTATASVTIDAGPSSTISYAGPFCITNATPQLPTITGTSGGTFSPIAGVTIDATTGAITPNTATVGTYTITYTIPVSGGCAVYTATTTISIVASFTSSISYTSPVCSSASVVAPTITGSIGGTFSSTAGLTIASATGIITPTTSTAGTYTITYNIPASGGCAAFSTTTTITITAASVATISYTSPFCSINSVVQNATLTGLAGGTYSSTAGLTINTITGGITPNTSAAGTYVITYTIAATATCPVFTTTASITITSAPTATIAYSSPFCSTNLTVQNPTITGTTGGSFSSTVGLTINPTTGGITPNSSTAGSYVVTYTIAAIGGCIVFTTTANVTITAAPTATISYTTSFCSTNTTVQNPTITGSTGGSFTSTAGLIINSSTGGITPNTSTSGTYTVTYSILATATCPTFSATTSVTITSSPTATIAYNGPYCANLATTQSTTLTGSNGGTFSSTLGLSLNSATGLITPNTSTAGTYTVTYTIPASGGCAIFSTTASVTITPQQNAGFNYSAASFCRSGTNPVANITGITGGNFTSSPVGLVFLNSSNGQIDLLASTANNYSITYTTAGPCPSSSTFSLSLTNSPNADFSYPNQFYCIDAVNPLITLAAGAVAGLFSSSPAGLSINPTTGVVNFASSIAGSYTISNTIAAASGCSAVVFSTTLTLIDLPIATATSTTVCENGIASLAATGGTTYSWTGPNGFTSTLQNPIIDSVSFADTGTYTVIATVLSCTASAEVTLLINPLPSISVGNNVSILEETSTVLTASGGGPYLWVPNNTLSCDTCSKVTATPTQTTTYCISKINPLTGCENEDCVTVTIVIPCREIFVPNAFSPNQDGENELECVFGTCFSTFNFNIFNRWGELVFSSQDQKFCWDGKYKGELCPTAVYVYSLTGTLTTGESVKKEGNISLIR